MKDINIRIKAGKKEFVLYSWLLVAADFSNVFDDCPFPLCIRKDCGNDFLCYFDRKSGILQEAYEKHCSLIDRHSKHKNEAQQYLDICGITNEQIKKIYSTLKKNSNC